MTEPNQPKYFDSKPISFELHTIQYNFYLMVKKIYRFSQILDRTEMTGPTRTPNILYTKIMILNMETI